MLITHGENWTELPTSDISKIFSRLALKQVEVTGMKTVEVMDIFQGSKPKVSLISGNRSKYFPQNNQLPEYNCYQG